MKRFTNPDVSEADSKFSKIIITRDGKCLNCGATYMLSCSHFFGRSIHSTRFDPVNCITLCISCHDNWESKKSGIYKDFMICLLGLEAFTLLEERSKERKSLEVALAEAKEYIEFNYPVNEIQY